MGIKSSKIVIIMSILLTMALIGNVYFVSKANSVKTRENYVIMQIYSQTSVELSNNVFNSINNKIVNADLNQLSNKEYVKGILKLILDEIKRINVVMKNVNLLNKEIYIDLNQFEMYLLTLSTKGIIAEYDIDKLKQILHIYGQTDSNLEATGIGNNKVQSIHLSMRFKNAMDDINHVSQNAIYEYHLKTGK